MDIVEQMRSFESDHEPDGWPAITMGQISALCDEVERLNSELNTLQSGINCTGYSVEQAVANFKHWMTEHDKSQIRMGEMDAEIERLQSIIDEANAKEPIGEVYKCSETGTGIDVVVYSTIPEGTTKLYARPIPAQQSPAVAVPDEWEAVGGDYDKSIHSNPSSDAWAEFFIKTFPRLKHKRDLIHGWFANAMMAMHDSIQSPRITEQDARAIGISAFRYWMNNCDRTVDNWLEDEVRDLLAKLNEAKHD